MGNKATLPPLERLRRADVKLAGEPRRFDLAKKTSSTKSSSSSRRKTAKKAATSSRHKAVGASSASSKTKKKAPVVKKAPKTTTTAKKSSSAAPRKKLPTSKSSATAAAAALAAIANNHHNGQDDESQVVWTDAKLKRVKTGLTRKDLEHFRELLMEKRSEILGDVDSLKNSNSGGAGNLSNMPLHMADVGSDNYEQEFTLGLVEWERRLLNEIDNAIERIMKGTYGVCIQSGVPIPRERLEIKPWAKYSIEVVRDRERRGLPT